MKLFTLLLAATMLFAPLKAEQRGPVKIVDSYVKTDNSTLLRGTFVTMAKWPGQLTRINSDDFYIDLRENKRLNTVRAVCYSLPRFKFTTTDSASDSQRYLNVNALLPLLDSVVAKTRRLGMYAVIDHHTIGGSDTVRCKAWWSVIAPRYAGEPHVLYEISNEAVNLHVKPRPTASDLAFQKTMYDFVRIKAPNTHLILYSMMWAYPGIVNDAKNLRALVSFCNASFSYHGYHRPSGWTLADAKRSVDSIRALGVPIIVTEMSDVASSVSPPNEATWKNFVRAYQWLHTQYSNEGVSYFLLSDTPNYPTAYDAYKPCPFLPGLPGLKVTWPRD